MWDVKPADLVACVDDTPCAVVMDNFGLRKNEIYTVRSVISWDGKLGIQLEEILLPIWMRDLECAFNLDRFRPVSKTRTEEFRKLVAPMPRALAEA